MNQLSWCAHLTIRRVAEGIELKQHLRFLGSFLFLLLRYLPCHYAMLQLLCLSCPPSPACSDLAQNPEEMAARPRVSLANSSPRKSGIRAKAFHVMPPPRFSEHEMTPVEESWCAARASPLNPTPCIAPTRCLESQPAGPA